MTEPIVDAMRDPAFYAHPVASDIHVVQTHISYVLLTGDYAYKIKKPVSLGFLDFSTLQARRHFCERELALNSVFAPKLYVGVVPIYGNADGFSLVAERDSQAPVEYVVKMRQFRERDVLLQVFRRGELGPDEVRAIARKLVGLHARSATDDEIAANGSPESMLRIADENFATVERYVGQTLSRETYDRLVAFAHEFVAAHRSLIEDRRREGRVRECHGDLHLNNLCRYEGEIEFFDRIEFNEDYKNIDVLYDLAFLVMELEFGHRADLANVLLNTYLEETGDYEGARMMPLFRCLRAVVRGEVDSIVTTDEHIESDAQTAARSEAMRYFEYALEQASPRRGMLIIMSGVSGSGKSTVARALAQSLNAVTIRSDALRKHLAGVPLNAHGADIYSPEMNARTYEELERLGMVIAGEGIPVILDAKFDRSATRHSVRIAAQNTGLMFRIVVCEADAATLRARLAGREGDVSDAGPDLVDAQRAAFEDFSEEERAFLSVTRSADLGSLGDLAKSLAIERERS